MQRVSIFHETFLYIEHWSSTSAADFMFSDLVPAPRHLTLERQLNKSVLIGWNPPDQYGHHQIESYHVYVDGNIKVTVKAAERTRALVEGVDSNRVSWFAGIIEGRQVTQLCSSAATSRECP